MYKHQKHTFTERAMRTFALIAVFAAIVIAHTQATVAQQRTNRPVLVEGNCLGATSAGLKTSVTPGTCGDYDGDGRIGTLEDTDEDDGIFGTLREAIGENGINFNGSITIVASGTFTFVQIGGTGGNSITLQAAPGVDANIDALRGTDGGATIRRNISSASGIQIFNSQLSLDRVVLRNLTIRNWNTGISVGKVDTQVLIDNCRLENNGEYGIRVTQNAKVIITNTQVHGTGYRRFMETPGTNPEVGAGIVFEGTATGSIFSSSVSGSFGAGILNSTNRPNAVCAYLVNAFGNATDFVNVRPTSEPCGTPKRPRDFFDR